MNLVETAYKELYPENPLLKDCVLKYSGRFRGFNANVRMTSAELIVNMSRQWKTVSPDIQKGLIQELLVRVFKNKKQTLHMDLYHHFIKSMSKVAPKTRTHPVLEESFERVNNAFFTGMIEKPNLKIGNGVNRLGTYEYATDTVSISKILLEHPELLDYVMYHELLHKKHQYKSNSGRHTHHTHAFRKEEQKFPNADILEGELNKLVRKNKRMLSFWWH